jgi:hypothetical protein
MALLSVLLSINTNKVVYITAHHGETSRRAGCRRSARPEVIHAESGTRGLALHGREPVDVARELARDGKAEPRAAEVLRGRPVGLAELLEQLCLVLCSHGQA